MKPVRFAHTRQHHLQLRETRIGQGFAGNRAPGLEPFPFTGERTDPSLDPIRSDQCGVEGEQLREFRLVGLELLPGRPDSSLLICWILDLDQTERQAVDEQHDIRPTFVLALDNGELVDRQPVVVGRVLEVDAEDLCSARITSLWARCAAGRLRTCYKR